MAKFISLLLLALIAFSMVATTVMANARTEGSRYGEGSLKREQCAPECKRRCSKTKYHNACIYCCNKCCKKCLCVPPGYAGNNRRYCACYGKYDVKCP